MTGRSPIFVHSLFRAGSTYLFSVFRRSPEGYFCYQEPLHELAWQARMAPDRLASGQDEAARRRLRHPPLAHGYHHELREVWPAWRESLRESAIYDAYFAPPGADIGLDYWRSLAAAASGRPLFQECRTAGRIRPMREALGGVHIYLWRNPWDQWWSCKVNRYFGAVIQLILCAPGAPPAVDALRRDIGVVPCPYPDTACAIEHFVRRPLGSRSSYRAFYLLWCHGLREGSAHADLLLNMDRLSDGPGYRDEMLAALAAADIRGVDLSDCRMPQGRYDGEDGSFFAEQEDAVHALLLQHGWLQQEIDALRALRARFRPLAWPEAMCFDNDPAAHAEQRLRALLMRAESHAAATARAPFAQLLGGQGFHHVKGLWSLARRLVARR